MTQATIASVSPSLAAARALKPLEKLGRALIHAALARIEFGRVILIDADQRTESTGRADPALVSPRPIEVIVRDPRFYSAAAFGGSTGIAEAFMDHLWDTNDLPGLIELITVNAGAMNHLEGPLTRLARPLGTFANFIRRNTIAGSRRNIEAHYDLGNEFFSTFLDPTMTYSCGIFENGAKTLEESQIEKIDRACRKLNLKPSDHLLEIGTGWGALACHAAQHYGCRVTTTTISPRQFDFAQQRIRERGLDSRITLIKQDYRTLEGQFDKLVSIEMVEAVGREYLDDYFAACSRLLKPSGAALIQAITIRDAVFESAAREQDFLKKYIFPGSCLLSVEAIARSARRAGDLKLFHLEDIGPHYVTTLVLWREAFHANLDRVRAQGFTDRFIRMWEYYLAYCEGAFRARHVGDVQVLLTKPLCRLAPASPIAAARGTTEPAPA